MTRKEAKSIMNVIVHMLEPQYDTDRIEDAVDMAIKALEQESCSDVISRTGAIEALKTYFSDESMTETEYGAYWHHVHVIDVLKALPPVTVEPKMGRWIGHREHCENLGVMPSGLGAYEWCSNCDCGIDVKEWHRNHYNYCPNCGAKMVEPQESEGNN